MSKKNQSRKLRVPITHHVAMQIKGDKPTAQDYQIFMVLTDAAPDATLSFKDNQIHAEWSETIRLTLDDDDDEQHSSAVSDTEVADDDESSGFAFGFNTRRVNG